jgi:hypothetical protein
MGARKWRAQSIYSALVWRFTARKFSAAAGDALSLARIGCYFDQCNIKYISLKILDYILFNGIIFML